MFTALLIARRLVAKDTIMLVLTRPEGFSFRAGQYIILSLPNLYTDGIDREFSIASAPYEDVIELAMRIRDSSFKKVCVEMPIGSIVQLSSAQGEMTLYEETSKEVWIAGGIGIVPFRSMLRDLTHRLEMRDITLLFSDRGGVSSPFLGEFQEVARRNPQFKLIVTNTQTTPVNHWDGERGRISDQKIFAHVPHVVDKQYSIVGTRPFVASMRDLLARFDVPESQIRSERFCGYTTNPSIHEITTTPTNSKQVSGTHRIT